MQIPVKSYYNSNEGGFQGCLPAIFLFSLILYILLFWSYKGQPYFGEKARKMSLFLLQQQQDSIRIADSLKRVVSVTKANEETQSDYVVKFEKEKIFGGDVRKMYYIIVGSYINPENAKLANKQYRNLGYQTNIIRATIRNGTNADLVSIKTFNNFDEAVRYLREFRRKVDSKTWIYSK
jgi:hypothetical protein